MYLSIATTHRPATDLGFLLHKHPERVHETELTFGTAWLFYPQADESRCEAALVMDVDPIGLVRGRGQGDGLLDQYVNDRPYAASSFLSVALNRALRTAMTGASRERQQLADSMIPLETVVTPLPLRGGEDLLRQLFEPLGWRVDVAPIPAPDPSGRRYVRLMLSGEGRLSALLNHLYVLIPVLDDAKHYWVDEAEVEKLLAKGGGWLEAHPARELIARRYLRHQTRLARTALARLAPEAAREPEEPSREQAEDVLERPIRLNDLRLQAVVEALRGLGATSIADLGCGEGKLLQQLLPDRRIETLIGLDPAARQLEWAAKRLKLGELGGPPEGRVRLLHGSLTYRDQRWGGVDAAVLMEVIEHLDADRLPLVERVVFRQAAPKAVIVTTPNADYNPLFPTLPAGHMRHPDHRFEWSRAEFRAWAERTAGVYGYAAALHGIGEAHPDLGAPTQMAVFSR